MIIEDIVSQHAEEAAFLWLLRANAVRAPHYDLKDLADLEERIEAHLDGLRVAGEAGWPFCLEGLKQGEVGEVFAAAHRALDSDRDDWLSVVLETVAEAPETVPGLVSATGWVERERLKGRVIDWLASEEPLLRRVGLGACSAQRVDCGQYLANLGRDTDPAVRAAALRGAGEMRRRDLLPVLLDGLQDSNDRCRFWAGWAMTLIGDERGPSVLEQFAAGEDALGEGARQLMLRILDRADAVAWVRNLNRREGLARIVVEATGIIGDPAAIPWLIEQMADPALARAAGEAFSMITGVDLAYEDLETDWPEGFEAGPTEHPEDDNVAMDVDEDLAWPAPELLAQWWVDHQARFSPGIRYLCGSPIERSELVGVMRKGRQRQRRAASLELALTSPEQPLFNTSATARRQREMLGLGRGV